ncbi:unnamed protein product [Vicia faba]|uniref:Uncharacterized protein n=1 Tax=Vicia faba TaxID=3906 RepID=A0AAV0ZWC2_VICFA|nr:unnamed protein product [Vicia faba]
MSVGTYLSDEESEDDAMKVMFDDTNDERTTAMDDGFEFFEIENPNLASPKIEVIGKSYKYYRCATKSPKKKLTIKKKKIIAGAPREMVLEKIMDQVATDALLNQKLHLRRCKMLQLNPWRKNGESTIDGRSSPKPVNKVKLEGPKRSSDMLKTLKTKSHKGPGATNDEPMIIPEDGYGILTREYAEVADLMLGTCVREMKSRGAISRGLT